MIKFVLLSAASALLLFTQVASAQQGDILVGGGTLMASSPNNDSVSFHPPTEKGGTYPSVSGDFIKFKHRLGFNAEVTWRDKVADYPGNGETYRPFFSDVNVLFQPRLRKKIGLDLMAGIGAGDTRTYEQGVSCSQCFNSSDHFMEHLGGGIRYYVWNHVFVRPEIHYYHIQNNNSLTDNGFFNSNNVFRVSASVGYTFGGSD